TPNDGGNCRHSAENFLPHLALQTLLGDEDGDGDVYTPQLTRSIQAMLVKPLKWDVAQRRYVPRTAPIDGREIYITPRTAVGTNVSGAPGLRPCDCGRVIANGQIEHFIRGEHIVAAFGMRDSTGQPLSVDRLGIDAIAMDKDRRIYLSFEDDHQVRLKCGTGYVNGVAQDGALLIIPPGAWTMDARGNVASVLPESGIVALNEAQVDAMVANAKMTGVTGACLNVAVDLDSLALDQRGGTFTVSFCGQTQALPNLLFTTETMTGAGIASTRNGGEIAQANGCSLARSCGTGPTTGEQSGLYASGNVGSINALESLERVPCRFVLGTPNPTSLGGPCAWHIGTNLNVAAVWLFAGNGGLPVSNAIDFTAAYALPTDCFPDLFPQALTHGPIVVPMVPDGWGGRTGVFGPLPLPAAVAPNGLLAQALVFTNGRWELSTPLTLVQ
ncbi:MAG: hypothetical protein KDC87_00945, partial [Planctomycetes bacterium]|nr:hypothetical protein [Planctomycetota bacterium]